MKILKYIQVLLVGIVSIVTFVSIFQFCKLCIFPNTMDTFAVIGMGTEINLCDLNFLVINIVLLIILITYLLSIVFIIKNKILGYVLSGVNSLFLLGGQFDELYNYDMEMDLTYLIPIIILILLIILSFFLYFKLRKNTIGSGVIQASL